MAREPSRLLPECRSQLYRDPHGLFVHDLVLEACARFGEKTAIVDASCDPPSRISYAKYGDLVQRLAAGLSRKFRPGERIAIYLFNCWEFAATYHAATLAGCIPSPLNPSYRDREVHHHLEDSGAVALISDGNLLEEVNVSSLGALRNIYTTRQSAPGCDEFTSLFQLRWSTAGFGDPRDTLAALPYSSGTTGLPKGVMLSHSALVTNVFQVLAPGEEATYTQHDVTLCPLPLYHIYGLNVVLNPMLAVGGTLVLMPRYEKHKFLELIASEAPTHLPLVPPTLSCLCQSSMEGRFPRDHRIRYAKSGAAPLAPELAHRFTELTGIRLRQGYGMTEASPVTHLGYIEAELYRPDSIGRAVAKTDCRLEGGADASTGELVMRGPQFMSGYWNAPEATAAVLRDGWYWSGDVASVDHDGFFRIVDRLKEMIKYKGFAIAPAELEAVLLEHPLVRDCGIVGKRDSVGGEIPCAFIVLRDPNAGSTRLADELCDYVGERLAHYKQPKQVVFVDEIPRTASGKILRRNLREALR